MKPVCAPCRRFFRPKRNGFYFIEGMPTVNDAKPGNAEPEKWKPYKLWQGDLWECPDCNSTIVVGTGMRPVAVQHQEDFPEKLVSFGATQLQVNDC